MTRPCSVPLLAWVISTMDLALPVSSSIVFHLPTGDWAEAIIGTAARPMASANNILRI